jgi:hypothetical protein
MHVAVDQSWSEGRAFGIDDEGRAFRVNVLLFADGSDFAIDGEHRVGVEDRVLQIAAQQETDVANQKDWLRFRLG